MIINDKIYTRIISIFFIIFLIVDIIMRYFEDNEFALFIQASLAEIRETKDSCISKT